MPVRRCVVLLTLLCAACGGASTNESNEATQEVVVFAAASLGEAFPEIEAAFEAANPTVDVQLNFAGSSSLREQILSGAPADVFASANIVVMDELIDAGVVSNASGFVQNSMQIGVPAGNPAQVSSLDDFANADLLLGACTSGVPCGDAAVEVFLQAGVDPELDTTEPDVRALVTKLAEGELDAGIVYRSDVVANGDISGIDLADGTNVFVTYPIAALDRSAESTAAHRFVDFVLGDTGQRILANAGFSGTAEDDA